MIDLSHLKGQRYGVFGLGRTGLAAVKALVAGGVHVVAWDDRSVLRDEALMLGAEIANLSTSPLDNLAAIVWSPGAPFLFPKPLAAATAARLAGVPIISDIQLLLDAPGGARIIGVTGSNGKSTTTALIGHILRKAGLSVAVGGNLGPPTLGLESMDANGIYLLELSSYQLELTPRPRFDIGVFLNLEPDHLDRHGGLHGYAAQKRRVFEGQGVAIIGVDDGHGVWLADRLQGLRHIMRISADDNLGDFVLGAALTGRHNRQNAMAAVRTAEALDLTMVDIEPGLADFAGLPHRQELTMTIGQARYINDSKATNAAATTRALDSFDRIHWIVGGLAKDGGLKGIQPWLDRILAAYLIGDAESAFAEQLAAMAPRLPVVRAGYLEAALMGAHKAAQADMRPSVVLLSPACASFDQFKSYEARGDAFRDAVHQLLLPQPQGAAA